MRTLIVGERPATWQIRSRDTGLYPALEGRTGRKIAGLCGISYETYRVIFARTNLLPTPGTVWLHDRARQKAKTILDFYDHDVIILLGRLVQRTFRSLSSEFDVGFYVPINVGHRTFFSVPHPSGRSRVWNDEAARSRAREFWRDLTKETVGS